MTVFASRPSSSFGYWRGGMSDGPLAYGQGSGRGQANSGAGLFRQGDGPQDGGGGAWHPTVIYLLILVAAEIVAFGLIARALR
jgi:hypothetical protein